MNYEHFSSVALGVAGLANEAYTVAQEYSEQINQMQARVDDPNQHVAGIELPYFANDPTTTMRYDELLASHHEAQERFELLSQAAAELLGGANELETP